MKTEKKAKVTAVEKAARVEAKKMKNKSRLLRKLLG